MNSYETGHEGERHVLAILRAHGISAEPSPDTALNDIHTSKHIIEVKYSNRTRYRRDRPMAWQFLLYKKVGHTVYTQVGLADFVILVCADSPNRYYIIPKEKIRSRHKITIPSQNYKGRWAKYLDAWEQLR